MNLLKVTMKYGRLIVFIHHASAEIWGFRYRLTLVIGTLKIMASTGVFARVVFGLKYSISNSFLLTTHDFYLFNIQKKLQPPKNRPCERFIRGKETHKTNRTPTKNSGKFDEI